MTRRSKKVALVGCRQGAWISVGGMVDLKAVIRGTAGHHVRVMLSEGAEVVLHGDGEHELCAKEFVQFRYDGPNPRALLCIVVGRAA